MEGTEEPERAAAEEEEGGRSEQFLLRLRGKIRKEEERKGERERDGLVIQTIWLHVRSELCWCERTVPVVAIPQPGAKQLVCRWPHCRIEAEHGENGGTGSSVGWQRELRRIRLVVLQRAAKKREGRQDRTRKKKGKEKGNERKG